MIGSEGKLIPIPKEVWARLMDRGVIRTEKYTMKSSLKMASKPNRISNGEATATVHPINKLQASPAAKIPTSTAKCSLSSLGMLTGAGFMQVLYLCRNFRVQNLVFKPLSVMLLIYDNKYGNEQYADGKE